MTNMTAGVPRRYPGEAEVLFGPMTGMEVVDTGRIHGTINHYVMSWAE